jgi:hypothetical protein
VPPPVSPRDARGHTVYNDPAFDLAASGRFRQIVDVTSHGTNERSAGHATPSEDDAAGAGDDRPYRPRRPNAVSAVPEWAIDSVPRDFEPPESPPRRVIDGLLVAGPGTVGPGAAGGGSAPPTVAVAPRVPRRGGPAWLRKRLDDPAMVLALTTMLVLVAAAIWTGFNVASRDGVRQGAVGGPIPIVPSAVVSPSSAAPAAPVTSAPPSPSVSVTAQPVAPQPTRSRSTPPAARTVGATVTVVNDRGGEFQLGLAVSNSASSAQSWEVVLTFPVGVTDVRAVGDGSVSPRGNNQVVARGRSGPGETTALAIGGETSDGRSLRSWTCTVNGFTC